MPATGGLNLDAVTIGEPHRAMASGRLTAAALTQAYLDRIGAADTGIGSVLGIHPAAHAAAAASDGRRGYRAAAG